MTAPFVTTLRARPDTVQVGATATMTIRAQLAEAWDTVRLAVGADDTIAAVKARALDALDPTAAFPDEFVTTYRGARILDESVSLAAAGVVNGATLLIEYRHRRPVR